MAIQESVKKVVKLADGPQENANATLGYLHGWLRCNIQMGKGISPEDERWIFDQIHAACVGLNREYSDIGLD